MAPRARQFLVSYLKILGVLALLTLTGLGAGVLFLKHTFRHRLEAPISPAEALDRLSSEWLGPTPWSPTAGIRLLHHRRELVWDGTSHEEWLIFSPRALVRPERSAPFVRIEQAASAHPLPQPAEEGGFGVSGHSVWVAEASRYAPPHARPVTISATLWPVTGTGTGWIARYEVTVVD